MMISCLATPALACFPSSEPFDFDYGNRAEVLVVGHITDYEKVQKDCRSDPEEIIPLCVYSRIFITVEKVLAGKSERMISALVNKWAAGGINDGMTGLPRPVPAGKVLIALEYLDASEANRRNRKLPGPAAPEGRPRILTVVEKPCKSAFIFDASSEAAETFITKWRQAQKSKRSPP